MAARIMFVMGQCSAFVSQQLNVVCILLCVCLCLNTDVMQHAAHADLKHFVVSVQLLPVIGECDRLRRVCWIPFNIKC